MRLKCRALESEVERRQLEAQDGWSTAAQLQQYFRNLHNVLRGSTEQEDDCVGEPSELAELVRNSVASLKNEYQELRDANSKNKEIISMLTRKLTSAWKNKQFHITKILFYLERLDNYEKEEKPGRISESVSKNPTTEMEYLRDEIAVLTLQLKE